MVLSKEDIVKKIYRLLAVLVCVFALSGCDSKDSKGIDFPASNQDDFEQVVKNWAESVDQMSDKDIEDNLAEMEGNEEYQSVIDALNSYLGCEEELGGYKEIKSFKYEKGDEKNQYNAIAKAKYKKRDCNIKCTFSVQQDVASLESLSFEPIYTTAENLKNAFINTILGMGTVFAVLILIIGTCFILASPHFILAI